MLICEFFLVHVFGGVWGWEGMLMGVGGGEDSSGHQGLESERPWEMQPPEVPGGDGLELRS